jgi:hypothetical protein
MTTIEFQARGSRQGSTVTSAAAQAGKRALRAVGRFALAVTLMLAALLVVLLPRFWLAFHHFG